MGGTIKYIHLSCVVITIILFFMRGVWMMTGSEWFKRRWTRIVPPIIDTVLLASAIMLTIDIKQYPLVNSWLTAKVVALFLYIGLGMVALTYGSTRTIRITSWIGALIVFAYIVSVALTKNPLVFF